VYDFWASSTKANTFCLTENLGCGQVWGSADTAGEGGRKTVADSDRGEGTWETKEAGETEGCGLGLGFFFGTSLETLEEPASAAVLPSTRALPSAWTWAPEEEGPSHEEAVFRPCRVTKPGRGVTGVLGVAERAAAVTAVETEPPAGAVWAG